MNEKKDTFTEIVLERRSIRRYDEDIDIVQEEMTQILEMATTAPSSSNMQPWRFVIVNRARINEMLLPHVQFNTGSVGTAAAVIAIYGDLEAVENAQNIMEETAITRNQRADETFLVSDDEATPRRPPIPEGKSPSEMVKRMYATMTKAQKQSIAQIDCGLVAMQLMQAARVFGYDTCPIGVYDREKVSEALAMDNERYVPIMLLTMGKATEKGNPPYRLPISEVARFI